MSDIFKRKILTNFTVECEDNTDCGYCPNKPCINIVFCEYCICPLECAAYK